LPPLTLSPPNHPLAIAFNYYFSPFSGVFAQKSLLINKRTRQAGAYGRTQVTVMYWEKYYYEVSSGRLKK